MHLAAFGRARASNGRCDRSIALTAHLAVTAPTAEEPAAPSRAAATWGLAYTLSRSIVARLLSLVTFVVLSRLLTPEDYGLVALAQVFVVLCSMLAASGYAQTLVQRPEVDQLDLDTVFWVALVFSTVLASAVALAAPHIAALFDEPDLSPVLQVLSLTLIFIGLGATHQAVLQRRLDFRATAKAGVVSNLVATAVGIGFAFAGFGVWALVVQTVLAWAVMAFMFSRASSYRPSMQFASERFWPVFTESRRYLGTALLTFSNQRVADIMIGAALGATLLGIYTVAFRMLAVLIEILSMTLRRVAFPIFSRLQGDDERLVRGYSSAMRMALTLSVPAFALSMIAAPEVIRIAFGPKWVAAIPIMQVLCLFGACYCVQQLNVAVLQAVGQVKTVLRLEFIGLVLQIATVMIALPYGLGWVAAAFVARACLMSPFWLLYTARALGTSLRASLAGSLRPLLVTAVAGGATAVLRDAASHQWSDVPTLGLTVMSFTVLYVGGLRLLAPGLFAEVRRYGTTLRRRGPKGGSSAPPPASDPPEAARLPKETRPCVDKA